MKATEQYFPVMLLIMLRKSVLYKLKILSFDHFSKKLNFLTEFSSNNGLFLGPYQQTNVDVC